MATYDLTSTTPSKIQTGDIINCPYSGAAKSITLPKGQYKLEVWGAQGGYRSSSSYGGNGGYSYGTITLTDKTVVYLYAGGAGNTGGVNGGFNGGGIRYSYAGGGGGSDIRIGSTSLYARVIVAGGGGSDGASSYGGGVGGGTNGSSSTNGFGTCYSGYGTQTGVSGGTSYLASSQYITANPTSSSSTYSGFGFGGAGPYRSSGYGGAGGGGWYGGGGSYPDSSADDDKGGSGGSGYVYTSSTASNYPSGCLLNSSYYLSDASTIAGNTSFTDYSGSTVTGHSGNGACRITAISVQSDSLYIKTNNSWNEFDSMFFKIDGLWYGDFTPAYDYGDGSLNTTSLGYEGNLYINGKLASYCTVSSYCTNSTNFRWGESTSYGYTTADIYPDYAVSRSRSIADGGSPSDISGLSDSSYKFLDNKCTRLIAFQAGAAGTNAKTLTTAATGGSTVCMYWHFGAYTTGIYIGSVKVLINGTYYTLQEMVTNGICKPLVIIDSHGINGNYYMQNCLNIYSGSNSSSGNYPGCQVIFMLNEGYTMTGYSFYENVSRGSTTYNDGFECHSWPTESFRLTLNEY